MNELVIATNNKHKYEEIKSILKDLPIKIHSLAEFKGIPHIIEDKKTLEENAVKKAKTVAKITKKWVLADDSGLEVRYLNNEPGVYSARWAGSHCSYEDNNNKLLKLLKGVPKEKRKACFRTVIALSDPHGKVFTVEGKICGIITEKIKGKNGFGYDPLFWIKSHSKTLAELKNEEKNKISHRAKALFKAKRLIQSELTHF
ncbi:MAG: XTP/dITP diphosphatase [Elusimicrobia bacterium]|nr:XTP/dITP diphosphatase [Elusimicrobiota bacterium]